MIAIIDYGAGNLYSVKNALDYLGKKAVITGNGREIEGADRIILPGVGSFGEAMSAISAAGLDRVVIEAAEKNVPLLGICLGLQLMFEESEESPGVRGLGIFKGKCVRIPEKPGLKIPHIGWNSLEIKENSGIYKGLPEEPYVYFVHSYYINAENENDVSAYTRYGERLGVSVAKGNVFATQFHPEKSGETGLKILKNFTEL